MNQPSALLMLADDLVVLRAKRLLEQLAYGKKWKAADDLKAAIEAREEIRLVSIVQDASDPQAMQINEPAPITERSVHHA
jgi:hypothetical protein